jgi:uncharacterized protein YoaH (UPF0181 family)
MAARNWVHLGPGSITSTQHRLWRQFAATGAPNAMKVQNSVAIDALMAGGATRTEARSLVAESLRNLRNQGGRAPSRTPYQ